MTVESGAGNAIDRLVRAARETDLTAVLALVHAAASGDRRTDRLAELFVDAIRTESGENLACLAMLNGRCVGAAVYGEVAGTMGTSVLHAVIVANDSRDTDVGRSLVTHAIDELRSAGARLIVTEIPGDASQTASLLESAGFAEESRVDDYYEDGVPLIHLRLL